MRKFRIDRQIEAYMDNQLHNKTWRPPDYDEEEDRRKWRLDALMLDNLKSNREGKNTLLDKYTPAEEKINELCDDFEATKHKTLCKNLQFLKYFIFLEKIKILFLFNIVS